MSQEKYIIFSDFHAHNHAQDWRIVDDAIEVLRWIKKEAIKREIKTIFFLGDFFHVRGYMYPSIVARMYAELINFTQDGIELIMLVGNHDMPYRQTTKHNSLTVFKPIASIVEQPMVWEKNDWNFYLLPYVEDNDKLQWAIDKMHNEAKNDGKKSALFAHLDIIDAMYHTNVPSTHGVSPNNLSDKFDMIITGHYHINQKIGKNIYYVGSTYQQSFGEANQKKGIYIFSDGDLEFVENTFSPKYVYVDADNIDESITGNYVKILANKDSNISSLREEAMQFGPRNLTVKIDAQTQSSIGGVKQVSGESKDMSVLLKEWVESNANPEIYDIKKLMKYGFDITERLEDGEQSRDTDVQ